MRYLFVVIEAPLWPTVPLKIVIITERTNVILNSYLEEPRHGVHIASFRLVKYRFLVDKIARDKHIKPTA